MTAVAARDRLALIVAVGVAALVPIGFIAGLVSPALNDGHWAVAGFYGTTSMVALFLPIVALVLGFMRKWAEIFVLIAVILIIAPLIAGLAAWLPPFPSIDVSASTEAQIIGRLRLEDFYYLIRTFGFTVGKWAVIEWSALALAVLGVRLLGILPQRDA